MIGHKPGMENQQSEYQIEMYRRMTPQQKYDAVVELMNSACKKKMAYLASIHPDWSEEKIQEEIRKWHLHAR